MSAQNKYFICSHEFESGIAKGLSLAIVGGLSVPSSKEDLCSADCVGELEELKHLAEKGKSQRIGFRQTNLLVTHLQLFALQ